MWTSSGRGKEVWEAEMYFGSVSNWIDRIVQDSVYRSLPHIK